MSLSNPKATNPATRFMQWRGGEDGGGRITWYDKDAEEEKEVSLPFSFVVLDELHTITGFSEKAHSGFWSNEVDNLNKELVVRTKDGIVARGKYADISDEIKSKGAKYAKSVYIAFKDEDGELTIGNIKIAGAAMTAWIDFQKKFNVEQCAVMITDKPKKAKKGSNVYFVPVFEGQKLGDATKKAALPLDETVQNYLTAYFNRKPEADDQYATTAAELDEPEDEEEDLPASKPAKAAPKKKAAEPEEADDDDDEEETIDLKDVPF